MSRMADLPPRLARGLLFMVVLVVFGLGVAGRTDLPMLNAFSAVSGALMLVGIVIIDPELARERWRRGQTGVGFGAPGRDPAAVPHAVRLRTPRHRPSPLVGPCAAGALALGSWGALAPALVLCALFLARTAREDGFLRRHLEGYSDYAARVRFRLLPGVW